MDLIHLRVPTEYRKQARECLSAHFDLDIDLNTAIKANSHNVMEASILSHYVYDCLLSATKNEKIKSPCWYVCLHLKKIGYIDDQLRQLKKQYEFYVMPADNRECAETQIKVFGNHSLFLTNNEFMQKDEAINKTFEYSIKHWDYLDTLKGE